jgi:hypothetical protein
VLHVTRLSVELLGLITGKSVHVRPTGISSCGAFKATPVTRTTVAATLKLTVAVPALLVALTVKVPCAAVKAAVGVPESSPVVRFIVSQSKPVLGLSMLHSIGCVPVAINGSLYRVPTVALRNVLEPPLITGGPGLIGGKVMSTSNFIVRVMLTPLPAIVSVTRLSSPVRFATG